MIKSFSYVDSVTTSLFQTISSLQLKINIKGTYPKKMSLQNNFHEEREVRS